MIGMGNNTTQNALLPLDTEDHGHFYRWCKLATAAATATAIATAPPPTTITTATAIAIASSCATDIVLALATAIDMATYIATTLTPYSTSINSSDRDLVWCPC